MSEGIDSYQTGEQLARDLVERLGGAAPDVALFYATVNHDLGALLRGLRATFPAASRVLGCSTQGVMTRDRVIEEGYASGVIGLGGIPMAVAEVEAIEIDTRARGAALGARLCEGLAEPPKVVVLFWDPLCGADMDQMLAGLHERVRCPIVGGGAGQNHSAMVTTFQASGDRVFSRGAIALALAGDATFEMGCSAGTSPVGVEMIVTKAEGNKIFELDGRPALDVWMELTSAGLPSVEHTAALAIGIPVEPESDAYLVRAAFGVDRERKGVIVQAGIDSGTRVMLHHRVAGDLFDGTAAMARELAARLANRTVRAVLAFECGARTRPFLGTVETLRENVELQAALGGATWLGMLAWGELYPTGGRPAFHNYSYPLLVVAE